MSTERRPPPPWVNWLLLAVLISGGISNWNAWRGSAFDWILLVAWLVFAVMLAYSFVVQFRSRRP